MTPIFVLPERADLVSARTGTSRYIGRFFCLLPAHHVRVSGTSLGSPPRFADFAAQIIGTPSVSPPGLADSAARIIGRLMANPRFWSIGEVPPVRTAWKKSRSIQYSAV